MTQCRGTRADGSACESSVGLSDGYCLAHHPDRRAEIRAVRQMGGRARAKGKRPRDIATTVDADQAPPRPESLADAVLWSSWCAHAVATGLVDTRTADSVCRAVREFRQSLERADLASEIARLKSELAAFKKGRLKAVP